VFRTSQNVEHSNKLIKSDIYIYESSLVNTK